jgi:hypothetical protein
MWLHILCIRRGRREKVRRYGPLQNPLARTRLPKPARLPDGKATASFLFSHAFCEKPVSPFLQHAL